MFKLFKAELKKILLRPSIFIMTGILAVVLVFAYGIFKPAERVSSKVEILDTTVSKVASKFFSTNTYYSKSDSLSVIESAQGIIDLYKTESDAIDKIKAAVESLNVDAKTFVNYIGMLASNEAGISTQSAKKMRDNLLERVTALNDTYTNYNIELSENSYPRILIKSVDHEMIAERLSQLQKVLSSDIAAGQGAVQSYTIMAQSLEAYNISVSTTEFKLDITPVFDNIVNIEIEAEKLDALKTTYIDVAYQRLDAIEAEIDTFVAENTTGDNSANNELLSKRNELNVLISKYYNTCTQVYDIINSRLLALISEEYTEDEFTSFYRFEDYNRYEYNQTEIKQDFLFQNAAFDYEYANPLSFGQSSNFTPNAYDFMYYTLELFSFIIIIYCVVIGSNMIAGEQSNGTLKLLAIRPYSRNKLLTSKILATAFFMIIFVSLSSVITFIAGAAIYGMDSLPILMIFDASKAFVVSPLFMILVYILSLIVRIFVYICIAFAISTIFKSHVGATTISILCYFVTLIFAFFLADKPIFKYIPLNNIDFFKYLGGGTFVNSSGISISNLFVSPILPDTGFLFSLIMLAISVITILTTTYVVFNKRDIA